jgi:RES domain-containing protein
VILWRISNHISLDGAGALKASGRWHSRGRRIVYCAGSPAAALLEILVHFEIELPDLPARYRLLKIAVPDEASVERMTVADLPVDWIENTTATQVIGDTWIAEGRSLLLAVPSAVVPATENVLINPAHPDAARVRIDGTSEHVIDPRLIR